MKQNSDFLNGFYSEDKHQRRIKVRNMDKRRKRGGRSGIKRLNKSKRRQIYGIKKAFILRGNAQRFKFEPELKVRD